MSDMSRQHVAAVFGGVYNNALSLEAVLTDARGRGASELICLGDVGGFGPHPNAVFPLLQAPDLRVIQGNYDHSIGHGLDDCACGYTDPRDNAFAQISYDYTRAHTAPEHCAWLRALPPEYRTVWGGRRVLCAHGSPRRVNEFLWESTSPDRFLEVLLDTHEADVLFVTHTGIPWRRELSGGRVVHNVGAIGRPANDGRTEVWYTLVTWTDDGRLFASQNIPVAYDHQRLAQQMRDEALPDEFIETILTGWWTTCLEILPAKERDASRF